MNDHPLMIVVVDDQPQIVELLSTYIRSLSENFEVHAYDDPEEARAFLLQNAADVLVTDFKMPKFDGVQLMKLVREDAAKILVSGYVSEITENQLRALNASILEKPVSLKQLGALIRKAEARTVGTPSG
ncbi:MAG: response regulator [Chitinispirillaceae bacterium]|nr:response regulator [Chitinispirillaceae bacterium]